MKRLPIFELGISLVIIFISLFLMTRNKVIDVAESQLAVYEIEEVKVSDDGDVFSMDGTLYEDDIETLANLHTSKATQTEGIYYKHYMITKRISDVKQPFDILNYSATNIRVERVDTLVEPSLHNTPYYIEPYKTKNVPPDAKARSPGLVALTGQVVHSIH